MKILVKKYIWGATLILLFLTIRCSTESSPSEPTNSDWLPITENVNGSLTQVNGIRILRMWGSSYEQGYAHGYLAAPVIVDFLNSMLLNNPIGLTPEVYESNLTPILSVMEFEQKYLDELQGLFEGMKARAGGEVFCSALNRNLQFDDALMLTASPILAVLPSLLGNL